MPFHVYTWPLIHHEDIVVPTLKIYCIYITACHFKSLHSHLTDVPSSFVAAFVVSLLLYLVNDHCLWLKISAALYIPGIWCHGRNCCCIFNCIQSSWDEVSTIFTMVHNLQLLLFQILYYDLKRTMILRLQYEVLYMLLSPLTPMRC